MVQPYDYTLNLPNPVEAVLQGVMVRQQFEQQQAQKSRQQALQAAVEDLRANPTPDKFADFYLRFPELKGQLDSYRETLAEGDKGTLVTAAREAVLAQKSGRTTEIPVIFERYATAAENSNRPDLAKQFRDAQQYVQKFPESADFAVKMFYQGVDPDGFKALDEGNLKLDTALIKNLVAEGLQPGTPEFQTALKEERQKITVTLPGGGFFSGSPQELQRIYGNVPPGAQQGRPPKIKSEEDFNRLPPGAIFTAPDGSIRTKPGGPTQTASGGFP